MNGISCIEPHHTNTCKSKQIFQLVSIIFWKYTRGTCEFVLEILQKFEITHASYRQNEFFNCSCRNLCTRECGTKVPYTSQFFIYSDANATSVFRLVTVFCLSRNLQVFSTCYHLDSGVERWDRQPSRNNNWPFQLLEKRSCLLWVIFQLFYGNNKSNYPEKLRFVNIIDCSSSSVITFASDLLIFISSACCGGDCMRASNIIINYLMRWCSWNLGESIHLVYASVQIHLIFEQPWLLEEGLRSGAKTKKSKARLYETKFFSV